MLKKSASIVLASLGGSTYKPPYALPLRSLRLIGEQSVLALRGWAGENVAFLTILRIPSFVYGVEKLQDVVGQLRRGVRGLGEGEAEMQFLPARVGRWAEPTFG